MNLALARWPLRLALAAGVAGIAIVRLDAPAEPDQIDVLLGRTATAMARAGFSIERRRESWRGTRAAGRQLLAARHPACALPVFVEAMGALNGHGDSAIYFYGKASGLPPGYVAFAGNALAMALNHALPWRDTPRPTVKMLAVSDPSACLAITKTDWPWIWFGQRHPET